MADSSIGPTCAQTKPNGEAQKDALDINFKADPYFTVERIQDFFAYEWPKKRAGLGGLMLLLTTDREQMKQAVEGMGFENAKEMYEAAENLEDWLKATLDIMETVRARIMVGLSDAFDDPGWFEKMPRAEGVQ